MNEKEIISAYMSKLAKMGHAVIKSKYGKDFYANIANKRWADVRAKRAETQGRQTK